MRVASELVFKTVIVAKKGFIASFHCLSSLVKILPIFFLKSVLSIDGMLAQKPMETIGFDTDIMHDNI